MAWRTLSIWRPDRTSQWQKHSSADGLSRITIENQCDCYQAGKDLSSLPCGGCKYCTRVHSQWDRFNEDVDDVVPLAVKSISICQQIIDEVPEKGQEQNVEQHDNSDIKKDKVETVTRTGRQIKKPKHLENFYP